MISLLPLVGGNYGLFLVQDY